MDPARLLWILACREELGLLSRREVFDAARAILRIDWSEELSELTELDRLEDPAVMPLFHRALAVRGVSMPSLLEAAWGLILEAAARIRSGSLEPREGAWRMVEVLYRIEKIGAPAGLIAELQSAHALMTLRDDAREIAACSSGERAKEFGQALAEYDDRIRDRASRLLGAAGLADNPSLAEVRAAAIARANPHVSFL